jgi:hypothetical protein
MIRIIHCLALLIGFTAIHAFAADAGPAPATTPFTPKGDRHPAVNLVYPESAFMHAGKGGRLVDVTKPPFNAKGDGKTDDTGALIAARDFVTRSHEPAYCGRNFAKNSYILYLPNGTYLVSDTVNHNLPVLAGDGVWDNYQQHWVMSDKDTQNRELFPSGVVREQNDSIIILGQSREKTILRLKDNSPGFGVNSGKPVLSFFRLSCGSDVNQNNVVENLTIDTGSGNPGAIGMRWNSANTGAIRNVTIRSGDGSGFAGLTCDVFCAQGLFEDISIDGFDEGLSIRAGIWGTIPTLEHASFSNQKRNAIRVANYSRMAARDVVVTGAPTALRVESSANAVVLDSSFQGKDGAAAMDLADGQLFARNIQTPGYASALVRDGKSVLSSPNVEEYVSLPALSTEPGAPSASLRLPIEESPKILSEPDPANWANVDDFGAVGDGVADDTPAIQKAMDSGKPAILFPKNVYIVNGTVTIPKTVRQVSFLYGCTIRTQFREEAMFCVSEPSAEPLLLQQSAYNLGGVFLDHAAARTLVLEDMQTFFPHAGRSAMMMDLFFKPIKPAQYDDATNCWRLYRNTTPAGEPKKLFVNHSGRKPRHVPEAECLEGGEDGGDLIGALFVFRPKQAARDSGSWPMVGRSLRMAATWAGSSAGQSVVFRCWGVGCFGAERLSCMPSISDCWAVAAPGAWKSGRSQRMRPRFSSAARSWLRATRRVRMACSSASASGPPRARRSAIEVFCSGA